MKAALLPIAFALTAGAAFAEGPIQGNEVFNFQSTLSRAEVQAQVAPAYKADVIARGEASGGQDQATTIASNVTRAQVQAEAAAPIAWAWSPAARSCRCRPPSKPSRSAWPACVPCKASPPRTDRRAPRFRLLQVEKGSPRAALFFVLAETVRFELTDPCGSAVFKTAGLNHSPTSPQRVGF
jgi:hypothetical protein